MPSATSDVTPRATIRSRSFFNAAWSLGSFFRWPIARRSSSASAALKPPSAIAIAIACSWKIGTPYVRRRIGSSAGCAYSTGSSPRRRRVYGRTNFAWIGPGRISATCTTRS